MDFIDQLRVLASRISSLESIDDLFNYEDRMKATARSYIQDAEVK